MPFGPNQTFVGWLDSFSRYTVGAGGNTLIELDARWTLVFGSVAVGTTGRTSRNLSIPTGASIFKSLSPQSQWFVGFAYRLDSGIGSGGQIFSLGNNDQQIFRLFRNLDSTLTLYANNTVIATTSQEIHLGGWYFIEMNVQFSGSSNVAVNAELRINGKVRASGTANSGLSTASFIHSGATANVLKLDAGTAALGGSSYCDFYAHNGQGAVLGANYCGDGKIIAIYENGDVVTDFTPSRAGTHFDLVNEHPPDMDTTYVQDGTVGHKDIGDWQDIPTFSGGIKMIDFSALVRKTDEGTKSFELVVGDTGSEEQSEEFFPGDDYEYYGGAMDADPATSLAWTQAGFNAKRFGIQIIS